MLSETVPSLRNSKKKKRRSKSHSFGSPAYILESISVALSHPEAASNLKAKSAPPQEHYGSRLSSVSPDQPPMSSSSQSQLSPGSSSSEAQTSAPPLLDWLPDETPRYVCADCGAHLALQVSLSESSFTFSPTLLVEYRC